MIVFKYLYSCNGGDKKEGFGHRNVNIYFLTDSPTDLEVFIEEDGSLRTATSAVI